MPRFDDDDMTDYFFNLLDGMLAAAREADRAGTRTAAGKARRAARGNARRLYTMVHGRPDPMAEGRLRELFPDG